MPMMVAAMETVKEAIACPKNAGVVRGRKGVIMQLIFGGPIRSVLSPITYSALTCLVHTCRYARPIDGTLPAGSLASHSPSQHDRRLDGSSVRLRGGTNQTPCRLARLAFGDLPEVGVGEHHPAPVPVKRHLPAVNACPQSAFGHVRQPGPAQHLSRG